MKQIFLFLLLSASSCLAQWLPGPAGTVFEDDPVLNGVTSVDSIAILMKVHGACGSTETFNRDDGGFHTATLDANLTVTLSNMTTTSYNNGLRIRFLQDATGGFTVTWPAAVVSAPQINPAPNSVTFVTLETSDDQVTIYARSDFATGIVITNKSAAYTTTMADANTAIRHPSSDNNARVFTIDSNANVKYPIGTYLTFINEINTVTVSITTDTMTLQGDNTTGSRTLAAGNTCTAVKVTATTWTISGSSGLTYWMSPELVWLLAA